MGANRVMIKLTVFPELKTASKITGDGTNSFPIDLNTHILENTISFLRIAAFFVYRSFEGGPIIAKVNYLQNSSISV